MERSQSGVKHEKNRTDVSTFFSHDASRMRVARRSGGGRHGAAATRIRGA